MLALLAAATILLIKLAPTQIYVSGDSQESLVTAQAIVQHGTIRLDAYYSQDWPATVIEENGRLYYYFPLGASVLSVPLVALQLLRGQDMLVEAENFALQKNLAALTVGLALVLIYLICRRFVGRGLSLGLTIVFVFGSAIVSTMGVAFWSVNPAFLFMLIALLILVSEPRGRSGQIAPYLLGGALFLAYLSRPTAAVMVALVFIYVLLIRPGWFLRMTAVFALLAAGFVWFSWSEFGQLLPSYYLPERLQDNEAFWLAVYANLASPGRGVLVYSPFLLAVGTGLVLVARRNKIWREPLLWLALLWIALHLVSVSQLWRWWGGWSFGSRFMTETLLAWLLIALLVWRAARTTLPKTAYAGLTASFAVLGALAIMINTGQGLFNPAAVDWNRWHRPLAFDESPQTALMLDWRYPQFLASPQQLAERDLKYWLAESPSPLTVGSSIDLQSTVFLFQGWYEPEASAGDVWRWSRGDKAQIHFLIDPALSDHEEALSLEVVASYFQPQRITVFLNGQPLGTLEDPGDGAIRRHRLPIDPDILRFAGRRPVNTLEFLIPDAVSPAAVQSGNPDQRVIGLALRQIMWVASPESQQ